MTPSSPLAPLCHLIHQVRSTATTDAVIFQKNEAATRAALIDPVLRALGWDTANVRMVEPEKTINTTWRADYALRDAQGEIGMLLEAKCLGSNLEKYSTVQQLLGYAFGFGVLKVIITDGIHWHFYTEFKPGQSTADTVNLLQDDVATCALRLVQWLDATQSGHCLHAAGNANAMSISATMPVGATSSSKSEIASDAPKAAVAVTAPLPSVDITSADFTDVSQLHLLNLPAGQTPKQLRLPNGTIKSISKWKDILLEVCRLVLKTNQNLIIPFPDKAGKKTFLFASQKPAKVSSTLETYKGQPVFIYTNYDKQHCVSNALYVLQQLPASQKSTTLAISF